MKTINTNYRYTILNVVVDLFIIINSYYHQMKQFHCGLVFLYALTIWQLTAII